MVEFTVRRLDNGPLWDGSYAETITVDRKYMTQQLQYLQNNGYFILRIEIGPLTTMEVTEPT